MPVHSRCNEINKDHSLAARPAAEAATQLTHCSCTRHVPRRVPRPCPCTTGVMKSTTNHLFAITPTAKAATQETHCSSTRHVPRRVPRPCPCTTDVMKSTTNHLFATEVTPTARHVPRRHRPTQMRHIIFLQHAAEAATQEH